MFLFSEINGLDYTGEMKGMMTLDFRRVLYLKSWITSDSEEAPEAQLMRKM